MPSPRKHGRRIIEREREYHPSRGVRGARGGCCLLMILAFIVIAIVVVSWFASMVGRHYKDEAGPVKSDVPYYVLSNADPQHPAGTVYAMKDGLTLYAGVMDIDNNVRLLQPIDNPFRLNFSLALGDQVVIFTADSNARRHLPSSSETFNASSIGGLQQVLGYQGEPIP